MKIVSGGQTGVDRAALDVALELGLACGGWCPRGRLAEDGKIPLNYPLQETSSSDYAERTRWNVRDSDGTLVLTFGKPTGGTQLTIEVARSLGKPVLVIDLEDEASTSKIQDWIQSHQIQVLNVAGPRESARPGRIHESSSRVLRAVLRRA